MNPKHSQDLGLNSGAYVLHALSEAESARFESLLADSEETRAEVTELADTAVELGLSVEPVAPPAALRASILDQLASTPQLGPLARVVPSADDDEQHEIAQPVGPAEERARRRWYTRPATTLLAAAAAVALVFGGGVAVNSVIEGQHASATASQITQIQAASDYRRSTVKVSTGGTATLIWAVSLQHSAIMVQGLDKLPSGKTYELWYIGKKGPRSAGTFDASSSVQGIMLTGDMQVGDLVGLTIEPAGGSQKPTTNPIVVVTTA
ncbi:MAG: anti-sigma factor [Pseudolysinimonas sp.]